MVKDNIYKTNTKIEDCQQAIMILSPLAAFVCTAALMPISIRILKQTNVVDVSSDRSSHQGVALRGAGITLILGLIAGLLVAVTKKPEDLHLILTILGIGVLIGILGFMEDVHGLSIRIRLAGQFILGGILGASIVHYGNLNLIFIAIIGLGCLAFVNMSNFMDGLNGMSGLYASVSGIFFTLIGVFQQIDWLIWCGLIYAAIFLAFIPWNLGRPGTFLGDSGSYLLGAIHVGIASVAVSAGVPILAAFSTTAIYVADTLFTLLARAIRRQKLTESHRDHVYQRLNRLGWSHIKTSLSVACLTTLIGFSGLLSLQGEISAKIAALTIIITLSIFYIFLPKLVSTYRNAF